MSQRAKKKDQEFTLTCDNDGHYYVVPVGKEEEFFDYVDAMEEEDPDPQLAAPRLPEGVEVIGESPTLVKFKSYRIED